MPKVKRIARSLIADEVFESLRRAILEREFEAGERLEVRKLAEDFDVSQMPVRSAINRLQTLGLVEIKPRSGTFVASVDENELIETFDIRRALECLAIESAIAKVSDNNIAELDETLCEMDQHFVDGQVDRIDKLNMIFHRRIVEISGSKKLIEMYEDLNAHIKIARVHSHTRDWRKRVERTQGEHRLILAGLAARDLDATKQALSDHIDRAKLNLIRDHEESLAEGAA